MSEESATMVKAYQAFELARSASSSGLIGGIDFGPAQFALKPIGPPQETREEAEACMPRPTVEPGVTIGCVVLEIMMFVGKEPARENTE